MCDGCYICDVPDLNIRNVDASLVRAVNLAAMKLDLTQRDYVIKILVKAVQGGLGKIEGIGASEGVQGVRGDVRNKRGRNGSSAVVGSSDNASADSGAVGESSRQDSGVEVKKWAGPPHAISCKCETCKIKKASSV